MHSIKFSGDWGAANPFTPTNMCLHGLYMGAMLIADPLELAGFNYQVVGWLTEKLKSFGSLNCS